MRAVPPIRSPLLLPLLIAFGCSSLQGQRPGPDGARAWPVDSVLARFERDTRAGAVPSHATHLAHAILHLHDIRQARRDSLLSGLERLALSSDHRVIRDRAASMIGSAGSAERSSPAPAIVARLRRLYRGDTSWVRRAHVIDRMVEQADRRAAAALLRAIAAEPYPRHATWVDPASDLRVLAVVRLAEMGDAGRAALQGLHRNREARSPFVRRRLEGMARRGFPVQDLRHASPLPVCDCTGHITICIVERGRLKEVQASYMTGTGDTIVYDKPFSRVYRLTRDYGAAARWFNRREPIRFGGRVYRQAGLPRVFGIEDLVRIGELRGVGVFAPRDTVRYPGDRIYVPARTGCEFQGYDPQG